MHSVVGNKGIPNCFQNEAGIHVAMLVWIYNLHKAWGMTEFAKKMYTNLLGEKERRYFYEKRDPSGDPRDWPIGDWCPGIDAREVYEGKFDGFLDGLEAKGYFHGPIKAPEVLSILKETHALFSPALGGEIDYSPLAQSGKVLVPGQGENGNTLTKDGKGKSAIFEADASLLSPTVHPVGN